jgi:hypothetical protein
MTGMSTIGKVSEQGTRKRKRSGVLMEVLMLVHPGEDDVLPCLYGEYSEAKAWDSDGRGGSA